MNRPALASLRILYLGLIFGLLVSCSYRKKISAEEISISPFFASNMVFQEGKPIDLNGTCTPNGVLAVKIENVLKYATANEAGEWELSFPPVDYKGEFTITIEGLDKTIELKNLVMGNVWVVVGDAWLNAEADNFSDQVFSDIQNNNVRYFKPAEGFKKKDELEGGWKTAKREYILRNEYLCHLLGEELSNIDNEYIGIINLTYPGLKVSDIYSNAPDGIDTLWNKHLELQKERQFVTDSSFRGLERGVLDRRLDDWDWNEITFPLVAHRRWFLKDRIIWLRKKVYISEKDIDSDFKLELGTVRGQFDFYFNGTKIQSFKGEERKLTVSIPDTLVKVWTNLITIRMAANDTLSGFYSSTPKITNVTSTYNRELNDEWLYRGYYEPGLPNVTDSDSLVIPLKNNVLDRMKPLYAEGMLITGGFHFYNTGADITVQAQKAMDFLDGKVITSKKYMFLIPKPGFVDSVVNGGLYNTIRNAQLESGAGFDYKLVNTMDIQSGKDTNEFYNLLIARFKQFNQ